ncbi:C6 finger domain-containing protein [Colletotrichum higginsianum IMI 349063]|uniref:C6 finger domain-containing protein n=2 Tax=Colletotrichum higginsianum TaxID=80884 RepID=A0A1B7YWS6_COLHI|nr:C6 finger domain-containing protein [Colletotrichum higginsianum IMI 349063]OBR16500.1 C6 finger domain-containing protein [Colletotrichum higginsianum IMI 349063]TID04352.1 Fusaric acid cluster transcription factor FUB10 [Colletotrichum higginsianum]
MLFSQRSACDRCRALKSRCSREAGASKCERCQRLQIDCFYSPPRRMGRPAKKRLSEDAAQPVPPPPPSFRRSSTMSSTTIQTNQSDVLPPGIHEVGEFQYGLGIVPGHPSEDEGHGWANGFEDPLLGLLQDHDAKLMPTEWMDTDSLRLLDRHDEALVTGPHDMPLTPPTTVGSLPNSSEDSWMPGCDQAPGMGHAESHAGDTLPSSPEANAKSSESAVQRLLDLQSLLFARRMAKSQDINGLSMLINTTVQSTETLIDVVESLSPLRQSVEGRRSISPSTSWGPVADATTTTTTTTTTFAANGHMNTASNSQEQHQHKHQHQRQQPPNHALTISLFMTSYLLLLDSYDELLGALKASLQRSRQSQWQSPESDFGLSHPFFNNTPGGTLNNFNLVSPFDLDVNSVVFLLSRMMKRLHKSTESRFAVGSLSTPAAHGKGQMLPVSNTAFSFDYQDAVSQDTDGSLDLSPNGSYSPMAMMGDQVSREVSHRHQIVMESLRVIRWLADEL